MRNDQKSDTHPTLDQPMTNNWVGTQFWVTFGLILFARAFVVATLGAFALSVKMLLDTKCNSQFPSPASSCIVLSLKTDRQSAFKLHNSSTHAMTSPTGQHDQQVQYYLQHQQILNQQQQQQFAAAAALTQFTQIPMEDSTAFSNPEAAATGGSGGSDDGKDAAMGMTRKATE